jgi:hypothetical protein
MNWDQCREGVVRETAYTVSGAEGEGIEVIIK